MRHCRETHTHNDAPASSRKVRLKLVSLSHGDVESCTLHPSFFLVFLSKVEFFKHSASTNHHGDNIFRETRRLSRADRFSRSGTLFGVWEKKVFVCLGMESIRDGYGAEQRTRERKNNVKQMFSIRLWRCQISHYLMDLDGRTRGGAGGT